MGIESISLVIPAYNEEKAIGNTIREAKNVLSKELDVYEIIVVDDCSNDKTAFIASSMEVKVIRLPVNMGYGNALKTGINSAIYPYIAICDADGTYNPSEFSKLINYAPDCDMVVGARTGSEFLGRGMKRIARWFQLKLVNFTAGKKIPDANSGMRVFKKESIRRFMGSLCGTFSFTTSLTLAMLSNGMIIKNVAIEYNPRIGSSHVKLFRDTLRSLQILLQAIVLFNPVKAFLSLSIFPLIFIFIFVVLSIIAIIFENVVWMLFSFSFLIVSCLMCFLMVAIGMLAYACQRSSIDRP